MIDLLGFRNLLEGRIPRLFYDIRLADIKRRHLSKHASHLCTGLILQLLQITHRQWTFCNGTVHLNGPDGLSPTQTKSLARRCEDLLWTDTSTLLDEDKYLLDLDFDDLGDGTAASLLAKCGYRRWKLLPPMREMPAYLVQIHLLVTPFPLLPLQWTLKDLYLYAFVVVAVGPA